MSEQTFSLNFFFSPRFSACTDPLGVENGDIPNENFTASARVSGYDAHNARLNGATIWAASGSILSPWIQVDIGHMNVSGLLTQGDGGESPVGSYDWITKLKVSTFLTTGDTEVFIEDENGDVEVIT